MSKKKRLPVQSPAPAAERRAKLPPALHIALLLIIAAFIALYFARFERNYPDGTGYYAYLSSVWKTHNLDMYAEFTSFHNSFPLGLSSTGYLVNLYPAGSAVLWSPFYLISLLFHNETLSVTLTLFTSVIFGLLTLFLLYHSARHFGLSRQVPLLISLAAFFGTPLFFYTFVMRQNAHALTAGMAAIFLTYWMMTLGDKRVFRWGLLGLLLGMLTALRTQEFVFGIVLLVEIIDAVRKKCPLALLLRSCGCAAGMFLLGFSPQLLVWKIIYGSWFALPQAYNLGWQNFALFETLFSPWHGLLCWTPVMLLGIAGLCLGVRRHPLLCSALLGVCLAELLANAMVTAFWDGLSFGIRLLTSISWIIGVGLIVGYEGMQHSAGRKIAAVVVACGACWSFLLAICSSAGVINLSDPYTLGGFLHDAAKMPSTIFLILGKYAIPSQPASFVWCFLAILGAFLLAKWAITPHRKHRVLYATLVGIVLIAGFDLALIVAARRPPVYQNRAQFVTLQDVMNFATFFDSRVRAEYYQLTGEQEKYRQTQSRVAALVQYDPVWHRDQANHYVDQHDYDHAIAELQRVIQLTPDYEEAYLNIAALYFSTQRYSQAIATYQQALAITRNPAEIYLKIATVYQQQAAYPQAIAAYEQAITAGCNTREPYDNIGNCYLLLKKYPQAAESYRKVLALDPTDVDAHVNLGAVYFYQREYALARTEYQRVLLLQPHNSQAQTNLAVLAHIGGSAH